MTYPDLPQDWQNPPAEFSLVPFWFWNDDLSETEIMRQMDDFQAHGVDAFVIHPRVGLPRHLGWMSRPLLEMTRFAIEQAQKRDMWVMLYDEGMYPSGSSSGQVVAENPAYQCRGLVRINLNEVTPGSVQHGVAIDAAGELALTPDQNLVAIVDHKGCRCAIVDRPVDAVIRGLHFIHEATQEPPEDTPYATDLLNPDAVACFIRLVYERFYEEFGEHFGNTVRAIFTDEPNLLGRLRETGVVPGTSGILQTVNAFLGYDFTPHLPELWDDDDASERYRQDYFRALEHRLDETYYRQLYDWCETHGIALTGHPAEPDATAHMRYFHIPGQDIVWRFIEPDKPSALQGRQSTQAKAAASVMLHNNRRRNANEFCGAYGHELTFEEMQWMANWLLVRGCNLLIPHAFYYSVRGPRKDERPPDVGPHSSWWHDDTFSAFARGSRRLSWLNTDSQHICHVAILGEHHHLPWPAAQVCFENQIDFNYIDAYELCHMATVNDKGIFIADQHYQALIVDGVAPPEAHPLIESLDRAGRLVRWQDNGDSSLPELQHIIPGDIQVKGEASTLRVRHIQKEGLNWTILFNEGTVNIEVQITAPVEKEAWLINPFANKIKPFTADLQFAGHELWILVSGLAR